MDNQNKICSVDDCNREVFTELSQNKCVLHCEKPRDKNRHGESYHLLGRGFYAELKKYIENKERKISKTVTLVFKGVHFPYIDPRDETDDIDGNYGYVHFFTRKVLFDDCHFYTLWSKEDFPANSVEFYGCVFYTDYNIIGLDREIYLNCNFEEQVSTHEKNITPSLEIYTCTFQKEVIFDDALIKSNIFIVSDSKKQSIFHDKLKFNNCIFDNPQELFLDSNSQDLSIELNGCQFRKKFKIRSIEAEGDYIEQQRNKVKLESLQIIDCTAEDGAYLRFGFLNIKNFVLQNLRLPQNAELNIGDCRFKRFRLSNFRNIGKFKLYKTNILENEKGQSFQIDNTSIGDADFQGINLLSFDAVKLFDNIFHNLKYTNIIWKNLVEVGEITSDKNRLEKQQDTYRTLKNVTQANSDYPQAIEFYAREMKNYKDLVKSNKNDYSLSDRITLWFNNWTNDFGLNWWKPLLILLVLTLLFYLLLLWSLDMPILNSDHWQYIIQFLNPIHKFDWVIGFLPNLINVIFKVFEGLLIYQIIQAFRKYTRKL
jgi:hypothetical protein